jgi:hypothetical protein
VALLLRCARNVVDGLTDRAFGQHLRLLAFQVGLEIVQQRPGLVLL